MLVQLLQELLLVNGKSAKVLNEKFYLISRKQTQMYPLET